LATRYSWFFGDVKRRAGLIVSPVLALVLLASCSSTDRVAGGGKAPPGYEPFECFPVVFQFRPGTAEMVDDPEMPASSSYKVVHRSDEWVLVTLYARSASDSPIRQALLHRRGRVILDWLSRLGRQRDRVEIKVEAGDIPAWMAEIDTSRTGAELGGSLIGMISHEQAEENRKAAEGVIFC
jgi:hypothetical protein